MVGSWPVADWRFEDDSLIITFAVSFRFDAVVTRWTFLSAFDAAFATGKAACLGPLAQFWIDTWRFVQRSGHGRIEVYGCHEGLPRQSSGITLDWTALDWTTSRKNMDESMRSKRIETKKPKCGKVSSGRDELRQLVDQSIEGDMAKQP